MADDPFRLLGVAADAELADLRSARNALAKQLHPDHGGDAEAMQALNAAFEEAVLLVQARAEQPDAVAEPTAPVPAAPAAREAGVRRVGRWVAEEQAAFIVHALPVEAFEELLLASAALGDVVDDDPPYVLEVYLHEPGECFCRLDLVPDAGASTVSITLAHIEGAPWPPPGLDDVRDAWVGALNQLG